MINEKWWKLCEKKHKHLTKELKSEIWKEASDAYLSICRGCDGHKNVRDAMYSGEGICFNCFSILNEIGTAITDNALKCETWCHLYDERYDKKWN